MHFVTRNLRQSYSHIHRAEPAFGQVGRDCSRLIPMADHKVGMDTFEVDYLPCHRNLHEHFHSATVRAPDRDSPSSRDFRIVGLASWAGAAGLAPAPPRTGREAVAETHPPYRRRDPFPASVAPTHVGERYFPPPIHAVASAYSWKWTMEVNRVVSRGR